PDLITTRTVLTRRGQHLYFRIPPHLSIASRKLAGVDLLSDGHYVVAPPTVIAGHEYRLGRGGLPKTLTQDGLDRINAFLDRHAQKSPARAVQRPEPSLHNLHTHHEKAREAALSHRHEALPATADTFLTADALTALYCGM